MPSVDLLQNLYSTCTCDPNAANLAGTPGQMLINTATGDVYVYAPEAHIVWQRIANPTGAGDPPIPVSGSQVQFSLNVDLEAAAGDADSFYVLGGRDLVIQGGVISLRGGTAAVAGGAAEIQLQRVTAGVPTNVGGPIHLPIGTAANDAISFIGLGILTVAERTLPNGSAFRALVGGGNTATTFATIGVTAYTL